VQVSLALRAVSRYRPNYEFYNPGDQRVGRVVEAVEIWLNDRLSEEEKQHLEEEMDTLIEMQESSQSNNVVVRAVACRELSILLEWMREIADSYPEGIRPGRRATRMWWGASWDDAERWVRG